VPVAGRAPAFKEWAVIVDALLEGEQIVDVRKGGIREEGRHFAIQATRFWLYPTVEHQRAELLKPAYRHRIGAAEPGAAGDDADIRIAGWADIVGVAKLTEPEQLDALESKLIWSGEYAASRLAWKRRDPLWVLALRAHHLVEAVTVPFRAEYRGCSSWVELDGLPDDPATLPSEPVLSDVAFAAKLKGAAEAVGGFAPPEVD
jgi:hypothetical protein